MKAFHEPAGNAAVPLEAPHQQSDDASNHEGGEGESSPEDGGWEAGRIESVRGGRDERKLRWILLGLACCLSVGSHFGSYLLGPLKKSLHTSEAGFSSLISSLQLVSTISPIFVSSLVPKYGAAKVGLVATSMVATGLGVVTWARGDGDEPSVGLMVIGLICFGCGTSPIAICQETIILSNKPSGSKSVARTVALGLILGKTASFVAAYVAAPLGLVSPRLPFETALALAIFSCLCCVLYTHLESRVPPLAEDHHFDDEKKIVGLWEPASYGDTFWLYIVVCALAGVWYSTIHLSSSLLQTIYNSTQKEAAKTASLILLSSSGLYLPLGWILDTRPESLSALYIAVASGLCATYTMLLFFHDIVPMALAILPVALGIGSGPLLLVMVVPRIVERNRVATALGIHKAAEMSGAIIIQSASSWILQASKTPLGGGYGVITLFLLLAISQLLIVLYWWRLMRRRDSEAARIAYALVESEADDEHEFPPQERVMPMKGSRSAAETKRGRRAVVAALGLVGLSWFVFVVNLLRR